MQVRLRPELERAIAAAVDHGSVKDESDFVNRAVFHYLVARDLGQEFTPEEIDQMIAEGLADIDRGDVVDGEEAFRQLRAHAASHRPS